MRQGSGLLGLIGVILLVFAAVAAVLTRGATSFDVAFIAVHAVAGLLAIIAYLSSGLESLQTFLGERSTKYGTSTIIGSLIFFAILTLLNFLAYRHNAHFDLTSDQVFSLSPQSTQVLQGLKEPLSFEAFVEGGVSPDLADLLKNYQAASDKVTYRLIDPDREPELTEKYGIKAYNTVRLAYGAASSQVTQPSEENLTNALIKLTRSASQTVCVLEGHGEPDIDDKESARGLALLKQALENETYTVKKVLLATLDKVPDDCTVVLVAGPTRPYLAQELPLLDAYIKRGGRMLLMLPPQHAQEFAAFLAPYGIALGEDVVVDQVVRLFQGPALGLAPLVETYDGEHEITKALKGRSLFPMVRSVSAAADGKAGVKATELAKTSASSWAETDLDALFQQQSAAMSDADRKGPVPIAVAAELDLKQLGVPDGKDARIVVFGSSDFASNQHLEGTFYNRDLLMNAVGWLVGQADLLSIRPRALRASRVSLTEGEMQAVFYLAVLVLPELLLLAGLIVWWRRE
ncbi:MAG: Gldg family protein [Deltaproteobacteria bacterium]|nr:Gldg family protein [Deltaproteobacteria bacterium]